MCRAQIWPALAPRDETIEFLSARWNNADAVVNVATVEIRFGVVVLIEKLVFYVSYKKIGVAGSHFSAHSYAINLPLTQGSK